MRSSKSRSLPPPQNETSGRGKSKLRRSSHSQMVLKQRYVFDGAGAADMVHTFDDIAEFVTPQAVTRTPMTDGGSMPPWHRENGPKTPIGPEDRFKVTSLTVNEGSSYVVVRVDDISGQLVSLALSSSAATLADYRPELEYSGNLGKTWTAYAGTIVTPPRSLGTPQVAPGILVCAPITNDSAYEGNETFNLNITQGGKTVIGTATIRDSGKATIFKPDGPVDLTAPKDDDRFATVTSTKINEGSTDTRVIVSPHSEAVFFVTGKPNQQVSLSLIGGSAFSADYGPPIGYSTDGRMNWTPCSGRNTSLPGDEGALLVGVPIANESINAPNETFKPHITTDSNISYGTAAIPKPGLVRL